MLRAVFIGYDNRLNRLVDHWLAQRTDLVGSVWIPPSAQWLRTWKGRREFLRKRVARRGLLRALDEAAYHVLYRSTVTASYDAQAANRMIDAYWRDVGFHSWGPYVTTNEVNHPKVVEYLERLAPDVVFAHCLNDFFGKRVREIPRHGIFIWHVGVLPEYRGLYSPFWTMHNADFENFGYSLFRAVKDLDAGEIYVQGRLSNVDVRHDNHHLIEHKAILASLPTVERFMADLERGSARPIERPDAVPGYYSYPGISDYVRQRLRVRRYCGDDTAGVKTIAASSGPSVEGGAGPLVETVPPSSTPPPVSVRERV